MNKKLILLDYLNIFYKSLYVNSDLEFAGRFTGGLYGFVRTLVNVIIELNPTDIIICTDCKPYYRMIEQPLYKSGRKYKKDPEFDCMKTYSHELIKEFLNLLGMEVIGVKGLEADDLIAAAVKIYSGEYDEVIAITNDSDLYQLFSCKGFSLWRGKKKGFYTYKDFKREFRGLKPSEWASVISYAGGHNGLPGIKGIGIKTAMKIVMGTNGKDYHKQNKNKYKDQIQLNKKLARLPYYRLRNWSYIRIPELGDYSERNMMKFMARQGIQFRGDTRLAFLKLHNKE